MIVWDILEKKKKKTIPVYENIEGVVVAPSALVSKQEKKQKKKKGEGKYRSIYHSINTFILLFIYSFFSLYLAKEEYVISGGEKGILKVWNRETGECIFEQPEGPMKYGIVDLLYPFIYLSL